MNRLPHDVVVVDETSMVSLSLMARLLEAVRPDARIILVGDPEQLASVEAGAVLGDIVGPASRGLCMSDAVRVRIARTPVTWSPPGGPRRPTRSSATASWCCATCTGMAGRSRHLAQAIQRGDADAAIETLTLKGTNVEWIRPRAKPTT